MRCAHIHTALGMRLVVIDSVRGRLQSTALEQALTTSKWRDRVLGSSHPVELPQTAVWVATGNNIKPYRDMVRRV
jgi:hypothetical protein